MVRRLGGLLKKDIKVAYRNFFLLIVIFTAVLLAAVTDFLIPESINMDAKIVYYEEDAVEQKFIPLVKYLEGRAGSLKAGSRDEIVENMRKDRNSIGLVLGSENGVPAVEFIMQGHENEQVKNALAATIRAVLDSGQSDFSDIKIVELKNNTGVEIPFNKGIVPLMILTEPVLLGLVLIAALVFTERDEETIISYTVTPGGTHEYLGSKIILMLLLGFISTLLITALTVGFNVDWLELMLLLTAGSIFGSTLGLFIASFFDNISKAMMWILAVSIILSAPQASYFVPSFAPSYIRIMPTYGLMFAIKEAVFPSGNTGIIYSAAAEVGIINIILYFLCTLSYSRKRARG